MRKALCAFAVVLAASTGRASAEKPGLLLMVRKAPAQGLVVERVTLPKHALGITATLLDGRPVPAQFVPDEEGSGGAVALRLPGAGDYQLRVQPNFTVRGIALPDPVRGKGYSLAFKEGNIGPSEISLTGTNRRLTDFAWNDRVHDASMGGFLLRNDRQARPQLISEGPVCTVVRIRARYCREDGARPPSRPEAVYDWFIFHDSPLVYVAARIRQQQPHPWAELHFLELNFSGDEFTQYAGGDPPSRGALTGARKGEAFSSWAEFSNDREAIGLFGSEARIYDGRGEYGTYLHGPWVSWAGAETAFSAWLWLGATTDAASAVQMAAREYGVHSSVVVTTMELHRRIAAMRESASRKKGSARARGLWRASLAEQLEAQGRTDAAARMAQRPLPPGWSLHSAGELGLALRLTCDGIQAQSLFDLRAGRELLAPSSPPLFRIDLRRVADRQEQTLASDSGWKRLAITEKRGCLTLQWSEPADARLKGIRVTATAAPDTGVSAWRWSLRAECKGTGWSVMRVAFPQIALAEPGRDAAVLYPGGPGLLSRDVWDHAYTQKSMYPNGWCAMQFMAAYGRAATPTGLYFGLHDPYGGVKELGLQSDPATRSVRLTCETPAPNMGKPGNGFALSGHAVWQLLQGDWFDAARIYRAWVMREAKWWPRLTADGRADTPLWMRELCAWAQTGGAPAECVEPVKKMQQALGVPIGFHWYNWHQIPFDNDYPHYFPTKPGVAEGVAELQAAHVHAMPYINGRLWDTHDRGSEDFEFTRVARPAVTKQENGEPIVESYGSREQDGSPVRLGVMCPTTELWQRTVKETVLRILNEVGTDAVYIDQIAAAAPALCMDPSHGHPLGGGHWWTEQGYWPLLDHLREAMPKSKIITTECNAEPYVRWMDGYLTWHWQYDGMVPAFPAVYAGAIQMFGRSYAAGATTRDDALCMKIGQQLVFGEQIGWMDPRIASEKVAGGMLRSAVRMRHRFRRYFYAGEMCRPLKLEGPMPSVRADWQWGGERWVTTDAVLTGAWRLLRENRLVLLFANVSDKPVTVTVRFDGSQYGAPAGRLSLIQVGNPDARGVALPVPSRFERRVTFPPRQTIAWELSWSRPGH